MTDVSNFGIVRQSEGKGLCEKCTKTLFEVLLKNVKKDIEIAAKRSDYVSSVLIAELQPIAEVIEKKIQEDKIQELSPWFLLIFQLYVLASLKSYFLKHGCFFGVHLIDDIIAATSASLALLGLQRQKEGGGGWWV